MPAKKSAPRRPATASRINTKEIKVAGENLLKTVRKLIAEGNVRRIVIKQKNRTILEIPLTAGAVIVVLAPVLAAVGAIAALVTDCTILVEREEKPKK